MNKSGIYPKGNRVLVKPDLLEEVTEGGIVIPQSELDKRQVAQSAGVFIAAGPDAWQHTTKRIFRLIDGTMKPVEEQVTGYSRMFAQPGERVAFARHCGLPMVGEDGDEYRLMNDEDITCGLSKAIQLTDIHARKRYGT